MICGRPDKKPHELADIKSGGGVCDHVTGSIYINGSDIADLGGLVNLTSVGGTLMISDNTALTNLDGLSNLTSVAWL